MISPNILTEVAEKEGVSWAVVEKDYFLTLLLEGISQNDFLRKHLVFKGGTALRKICFKHYRYSEDLDFTLITTISRGEIIEELQKVFDYLRKEHNAELKIKESYGKDWFHDIKIQFTGLKGIKNTITMDLISDEIIADKTSEEEIFNPYYKKKILLQVYSLEEILAEKLRSLLQRTRVRDYYDVWYILKHSKNKINVGKLREIFNKKVKYKKIDFKSAKQFFEKNKVEQAKAYYQRQVAHQLRNPPQFDTIIKELEELIKNVLTFS